MESCDACAGFGYELAGPNESFHAASVPCCVCFGVGAYDITPPARLGEMVADPFEESRFRNPLAFGW